MICTAIGSFSRMSLKDKEECVEKVALLLDGEEEGCHPKGGCHLESYTPTSPSPVCVCVCVRAHMYVFVHLLVPVCVFACDDVAEVSL